MAEPTAGGREQLWTCPDCGHRFVSVHPWHSCGRYALEDHFRGRPPIVRDLFDRLRDVVEACGPVTIYAQKTRIVCQVLVRFASCQSRRDWLRVGLWLTREAAHPRLVKVERYGPASFGHGFRMEHIQDFDLAFEGLVQEAYRVGQRQHLS